MTTGSVYKTKKTQSFASSQPKQDPRLRKILVETLDNLKRPDAIPSNIIYAALLKASDKS